MRSKSQRGAEAILLRLCRATRSERLNIARFRAEADIWQIAFYFGKKPLLNEQLSETAEDPRQYATRTDFRGNTIACVIFPNNARLRGHDQTQGTSVGSDVRGRPTTLLPFG